MVYLFSFRGMSAASGAIYASIVNQIRHQRRGTNRSNSFCYKFWYISVSHPPRVKNANSTCGKAMMMVVCRICSSSEWDVWRYLMEDTFGTRYYVILCYPLA